MTFNACIKKHFDEAFGPYGFKKIKSKYPYWGRMVGDEILQIITYKNEWSMKPYKDFSIWGGVATVYRKKIDLDIAPRDQIWMQESRTIYELINNTSFENYDSDNSYDMNNELNMEDRVKNATEIASKGLLQELLLVMDLKTSIDFWAKYDPQLLNILSFDDFDKIREEDEGVVLFKEYNLEEYILFKKQQRLEDDKILLEMYSQNGKGNENEYYDNYKRDCSIIEKRTIESIDIFRNVCENDNLKLEIANIVENHKKNNVQYLYEKGII